MGVKLGRGIVGAVSEPGLNVLHRNSVFQQQTGTAMSEIVKTNLSQAVLLQNQGKVLRDIIRFHGETEIVYIDVLALVV